MTAARGEDGSSLSIDIQGRIDRICLEFEDLWRAGKSPRMEDFLGDTTGPERDLLFVELLRLDWDYRNQNQLPRNHRDQDDSDACYRAYLQRFPQDEALLQQVLEPPEEAPLRVFSPQERIGRFQIESKLGEGAFGVVYAAIDGKSATRVALKVPHPRVLRRLGGSEHLEEEARTLSRLNHPAIVAFREILKDDPVAPILVMEHVDGCSLRDWMKQHSPSWDEIASLVAQIADAMDYAHREGFVHRDLEPKNIVIDRDHRPHVTDFGLALHESVQRGRQGETAGSIAYMSPEQIRGESHWLDGRADIWALGIILYEFLTGRRPFQGDTLDELGLEIRQREPKPPRQINPDIPAPLEAICLKCLSKPISERFTTAGDLARELRATLRSVETKRRPWTIRERRRWMWSSLAGLTLGVVGLRYWLLSLGNQELTSLEAILDVRVTKSTEPKISNVGVRDPRFVPLRPDDEIHVAVRLNRLAYLYVLLIDSQGRLSVVYPWTSPALRIRASQQPRVVAVSLPSEQNWILDDGPRGVQTIFVLASEAPLPSRADLRTMLEGLESQAGDPGDQSIFFTGKDLASESRAVIAPRPEDQDAAWSPALLAAQRNCGLVASRMSVYFDAMVAVAMPFAGRRSNASDATAVKSGESD